MPKWQDLAPQDDPNSYYRIDNMFPNVRGTYELGFGSTGTNYSGASAGVVSYAAAFYTLGTVREFVVDATHIWEVGVAPALTDRTNGVTVTTSPMMAQYGAVTICAMGTAQPTVVSTSTTFANLAAAPQAYIVLVHANAVLMFNTNTSNDGWAASDVGDYTNWTTGEAASGRIFDTPGPITAAVSYGGHVYVFKQSAIYRMSYVGGDVKWQIQLVWKGLGIFGQSAAASDLVKYSRFQAIATKRGIAFVGNDGLVTTTDTDGNKVWLFDGSSPPIQVNKLTSITGGSYVVLRYNPSADVLTVCPGFGSSATGTYDSAGTLTALYYYYCIESDMWGSCVGGASEIKSSGTNDNFGVLQGDYIPTDPGTIENSKPVFWAYRGTSNQLVRNAPTRPSFCRIVSRKFGRVDGVTTADSCTPLLRRRTDLGTDSATCDLEGYKELHHTFASASFTRTSIAENSSRNRFDLKGGACSANYLRVYVRWNALDVEVDDLFLKSSFVLGAQ